MAKKSLSMEVQDVVDVYRHSLKEWEVSRAKGLECYQFCMNDQWSEAEISKFLKESRPPIVYNLLIPRLHNLIGTEQLNRRSARIRPSSGSNKELAAILNGLWLNIWETEEGEYEIEKAFLDGLIMPIPGWIRIDVENNPIGFREYRIASVNPLSVIPDPDYRRYNLKDCQWILQENWLSPDQIRDVYGEKFGKEAEKSSSNWFVEIANRVGGWFGGGDTDSEFYEKDGNRLKVIEMQTRKSEIRQLFIEPASGQYYLLTKKDANEFAQGNPNLQFLSDQSVKRVHITTICPYLDEVLVDEPYFIDTDMYNLIPYHSFDYNNVKSKNNSLIKSLIDPQKNLNKREIQKTAYIDHSINSPVLFPYEDKESKDEFESRGNKPGIGLLYRNYKAKPSRLQPANLTSDVWNDIADSVNQMNDISGINETARGESQGANESGRLFAMKSERVGATINPYFRNLSKTRKMCGEYFLKTVAQVYMEDNRVVDITERAHVTAEVVLNNPLDGSNDVRTFEGKVVLDEAEYSPTRLQENMQTKIVLAQSMPPELVNWAWVLKDMELPDIQEQIDYIGMITGIQQQQGAEDRALQQEQMISDQVVAEKVASQPKPQPAKGQAK